MKHTIYEIGLLNEGDFIQWCHDNGHKVEEMDFNTWLDWEETNQWDNLLESLNEYDQECMITGTLGLWWGSAKLEPTHAKSVNMALNRCIGSDRLEKVIMHDRYFEFVVSHHDGTNRFKVYLLSPVGLERYYNTGKVGLTRKENTLDLTKVM
jgi:hypothetical protein